MSDLFFGMERLIATLLTQVVVALLLLPLNHEPPISSILGTCSLADLAGCILDDEWVH